MNIELTSLYSRVVEHFGGQILTAKALGVEQPSVNAWVKGKTKMSIGSAIKAEKETFGKFKASDLSPAFKKINEQYSKVNS